jgi:hypothetical protein
MPGTVINCRQLSLPCASCSRAEPVSLPLWFTYCLMRCEPFPTPLQAMNASDDPNYKASDAPRKHP